MRVHLHVASYVPVTVQSMDRVTKHYRTVLGSFLLVILLRIHSDSTIFLE